MSYFEWNIIHISKFKPGTVEKNSSTIGPPVGIELRLCDAGAMLLPLSYGGS